MREYIKYLHSEIVEEICAAKSIEVKKYIAEKHFRDNSEFVLAFLENPIGLKFNCNEFTYEIMAVKHKTNDTQRSIELYLETDKGIFKWTTIDTFFKVVIPVKSPEVIKLPEGSKVVNVFNQTITKEELEDIITKTFRKVNSSGNWKRTSN